MTRIRIVAAAVTVACVCAAGAPAQVDLSGRWRLEGFAPFEFIDIEQVGLSASFTLGEPPMRLIFSGRVDNPFFFNCSGDSICADAVFAGHVLPDNSAFLAAAATASSGGFSAPIPVLATRCECDDGNAFDGDGCGADCRVEECYSCSGSPSVCTPLGNGESCDDGRDCTSGETCNAGACGGGSPVSSCIDMTGIWEVRSEEPSLQFREEAVWHVTQRDGNLFVRDTDDAILFIGTIDVASGTVALRSKAPDTAQLFVCGNVGDPTSFDVRPDGDFFAGVQDFGTLVAVVCNAVRVQISGARRGAQVCGNGVVEPPEVCDDGNLEGGDCCGPTCAAEADGNRCEQTCGVCVAGLCTAGPLPLAACAECDSGDGCAPARLVLRDESDDTRDAFLWKWPGAAEVPAASLAIPGGTSAYDVCIYLPLPLTTTFFVAARLGDDASCRGGSCWRALGDPPGSRGLSFRGRNYAPGGIFKVQLRPGVDGEAQIVVRGRGADLGTAGRLPLSSTFPIRAELRAADGACWRSTFRSPDAARNERGLFKGRSE